MNNRTSNIERNWFSLHKQHEQSVHCGVHALLYLMRLEENVLLLMRLEEKCTATYEILIHRLKKFVKVLNQMSSGYISVSFISSTQYYKYFIKLLNQ